MLFYMFLFVPAFFEFLKFIIFLVKIRPGSKVISLMNFEPYMGLKIGLTLREVGGN